MNLKLLTEKEVAPIIRKSVGWLRKARSKGTGPMYRKVAGRVFYEETDVKTWFESYEKRKCVR